MKKRHLSKNEILAKMREVGKLTKGSYNTPFTAMATLCNYVLWKEEGFGQKRLAEYNNRVSEYEYDLDGNKITIQQLSERLMSKADFTIEYLPWTETDITATKNSFMYQMEKRVIDANNTINEMSTRYLLIHFNVLMDNGYGKTRLVRNKDDLNRYLANAYTDDGTRIMEFRKELIDKVGICIEMPDVYG